MEIAKKRHPTISSNNSMTARVVLVIIFACQIGQTNCGHNHPWDHEEQHAWANLPGSRCAEGKQSPINIDTNDITQGESQISLTLIGYDDPLDGSHFILENNGHTVQLTLDDTNFHGHKNIIPRVKLSNGNIYQFTQLHFHWHQNDTEGSEHAINGRRSALEMHNVHFNEKYVSLGESLKHEDGILVIASLFEVSSSKNVHFQPLTSILPTVQKVNSVTTYKGHLTLGELFPESDSFYNYNGSLTTPPCAVVVSWIIFSDSGEISLEQLNQFRSLLTHDHSGKLRRMSNNVRKIQETGDRTVMFSSLIARQDAQVVTALASVTLPWTLVNSFITFSTVIYFFKQTQMSH